MQQGVSLSELSLADYRRHAEEIDESVYECLGCKNAVAAFVSYGSTAPDQVKAQIERWQGELG